MSRMDLRFAVFAVALALGPAVAVAGPSGSECGLPDVTGARDLHRALSLRAVEVVKRAANPTDDQAELIAPSATFSLGAGDVGRPMRTGVEGAREFARTMHADTYRFLGWDYMDMPVDACARRDVEMEFIDSRDQSVSKVEFTFEGGRVVKAAGWQRSFETGLVEGAARSSGGK